MRIATLLVSVFGLAVLFVLLPLHWVSNFTGRSLISTKELVVAFFIFMGLVQLVSKKQSTYSKKDGFVQSH